MKFTIKSEKPASARTGCVILGVFEHRQLSPAAAEFDKSTRGLLKKLLQKGEMDGKCGQTLMVHYPEGASCDRVLLAGCGKIEDFNSRVFNKVVAGVTSAVNQSGATDAVSYLAELDVTDRDSRARVKSHVEITRSSLYTPDQLKSKKDKNSHPLRRLAINLASGDSKAGRKGLAEGTAVADGVELARTLGDLPGNICTPSYLASQARKLGKTSTKLKVSVLDEAAMKKLGMGSLLSVSRGSREPAKLISLQYKGGKTGEKPVVLVGKGVTFDSGGISLKPGAAMDEMKYDMLSLIHI